ncbi:copper resistance protein B [Allohahella sp. A8]|uniref:copper resistance protein B n=1 Tax=Allohahella sp. A8 TaxID=3141461 RepID=UPI003A7F6EF6
MKNWTVTILAILSLATLATHAVRAEERKGEIPNAAITAPLPEDYDDTPAPPPEGKAIRKMAVDEPGKAAGNFGALPVHDDGIFATLAFDRFEQRFQDGPDIALWDLTGWVGEDYNKLYIESEGTADTENGGIQETEMELLYGRNIASFWDLQVGLRHDFIPSKADRDFLAFGVQGLAPYWFEVDATAYISDDGDVSAIVEVEYSMRLTQRLYLQPRFETSLALQDVEAYNIGSGVNGFELGLRMGYEIVRRFAPYIGVEWEQNVGSTKNMLEKAGEDTSKTAAVAGLRFWF